MICMGRAMRVAQHLWRQAMCACLFLALPTDVRPQLADISVERFSAEQGMLGSEVYCILQDSRGYLWFGTELGLNRYDGYSFTVFKHEPGNSSSIVDARVQSLWEDREGTLWVGTWDGLERFDRVSNSFSHFLPDPQSPSDYSLWGGTIYDLREDKNGTLWTGGDGLKTFDRTRGTFTHFRHDSADPGSLLHNSVNAVYEDRAGTLWVGTGGGLDRYDEKTGKFIHYWVDPNIRKALDPDTWGFHWIQRIYEDEGGILWLCTNRGPVAFDRKIGTGRPYYIYQAEPDSSPARSVSSMCEDGAGTLWIGTWGGGLMTYDAQADSFVPYRHDPLAQGDLSVCALGKDKSGGVWVGTQGGGVIQIVSQQKRFTPHTHRAGDKTSLQNDDIRFIHQDRFGAVIIGTATGIDVFDPRAGVFRHLAPWEGPCSVTGFLEDGPDAYWMGVEFSGLTRVLRRPDRRESFDTHQAGLGGSACSIFRDRDGLLWMAIDAGLCQFNPRTGEFKDLGIGSQRTFVSARLIVEDSIDATQNGWAIWIGTNDGLWMYDARVKAFARFAHDPRDPTSLASNTVTTVFRDTRGALWVGTDQGLSRMGTIAGRFESYGVSDGLPDNVVLGILEDDQGRFWVSTPNGISKFNPQTHRFSTYLLKDVLPNIRFGAGCCLRNATGEMYFGGRGGFVTFHPDSIRDNPYVPPIAITAFRKFDAPAPLDSAASEKRTIDLSFKDNVFSFEFVALNFVRPGQNQYAYTLEGHDSGWIYCGTRQYARYMNVPVGSYLFRVRGSNNDGVWNDEGASLRILITPPYWQTGWAYAVYGVVLVALFYTGYRLRVKQIHLRQRAELEHFQAEHLAEVDRLKSRFFANISHEFRTPLTLILGPIRKWLDRSGDQELRTDLRMMERNAQRLLRLISQLLDLSKIEAGGMKLRAAPGNIVPFVRGIAESFQSSAGRRGVSLMVEAEESEIEAFFDRDKLEKILTNLFSNAFSFTESGGAVTVSIHSRRDLQVNASAKGDCVEIAICDTGIGIPQEELAHVFDRFYQVDGSHTREREGTGIGLALAKELIELHRGTINLRSEAGRGTECTLRLPLGRGHLKPEEIVVIPAEPEPPAGIGDAALITEPGRVTPERSQEHSKERPLVLFVEDNADVRAYMRMYLMPAYQVLEACDGSEGVEKARESIPDLIISDVMMPKMDGYELCRLLKGDEKTSHVPIILLTAKAAQEDRVEGLETGADDYLTKPFDAKELLIRVKNLIELRRKLRERFSRSEVLKPGEIAVTSMDDAFLQKVMAVVEGHIGDEDFSVERMGKEVGMSRSQIHRKLTALTGQSPIDFIHYIRLHRAMEMLKKNAGTVSEIAYAVGFGGASHFTKCFREQFDMLPSDVRKS